MRAGICSGSVFKNMGNNSNKFLEFCKENNIEDVEFTFKLFNEMEGFHITDDNINYFKKCKTKSIHFPFKEKINSTNKENIKNLEKIYHTYGFNNITIHPNMIEDTSLINTKECNYSLENIKPKKDFDIRKIKEMMKKIPEAKFILDTTHAFHYHEAKPIELFDEFQEKITFFHFSDLNHDLYEKSFGTRKIILTHMIKLAQQHNIPIMIETEKYSIYEAEKDIKAIREILERNNNT